MNYMQKRSPLKRARNFPILIGSFLFLAMGQVRAQNISYDLSAIPENLKENASVITQFELQRYVVDEPEKASFNSRKIYTVVSEEGKEAQVVAIYSTHYTSLDELEVKVYDKTGKQLSRYKKKDMVMQATGEGLIEDGAYYYLGIPAPSYPLTIDMDMVIKLKGTLNPPSFRIVNPGESVVESTFEAVVPKAMGLRYKPKNIDLKAVEKDFGNSVSYIWTVKNLPSFSYEEGAVKGADRYPSVDIVLNKFSHYGNDGDLSSWNHFGQWIGSLYKGLDELPESRAQFFRDLVKGAKTDQEKARIIYKYMQDNFRYVSIQLGIGGLRPFSATFTDEKKYGDCKGLSNFMKAALATVGVRSHVAIINAEYNALPVDPAFPANDFDHVILCIPQKSDSIWLECTSNTAEFGQLGTFTENRNALLVTENGGVLVPTPKSKAESNLMSIHNKIDLFNDASGFIESSFQSTGAYSTMIDLVLKENRDDQKESIVFYLGYRQPDDFIMAREQEKVNLKLEFSKIPEFTAGNKQFLAPHPYKLWSRVLPKAENRKFDYYFRNPFVHRDTTVIKLPEGYEVDALPKPRDIQNKYAEYHSDYRFDASTRSVVSTVELKLLQHHIPASDYATVKQFFEEVIKEDKQRIVIRH